jgi:hypothetical protein
MLRIVQALLDELDAVKIDCRVEYPRGDEATYELFGLGTRPPCILSVRIRTR